MSGMQRTPPGAAETPPNLDALEARIGLRIAGALAHRSDDLPHDIAERLKVARLRAVERGRELRQQQAPVHHRQGGTLVMSGAPSWWLRLASLAPLALLLVGLLCIQRSYVDQQVNAAAELDAAILTDDLPPQAYSDQGFAEYLRTPHAVE